jgi:hypothetical protein
MKKIYRDQDDKTRKEKKQRSVFVAAHADAPQTKIFPDSNLREIEAETDEA